MDLKRGQKGGKNSTPTHVHISGSFLSHSRAYE